MVHSADNLPVYPTMEAAKAAARERSRETGDIWCARAYKGGFVAYMMGFDFPGPDDEDSED